MTRRKPRDPKFTRRLDEVRVDEHGQHAERLVVLDEAHPAHVRGEVVHLVCTLNRLTARFPQPQIDLAIVGLREALEPEVERLAVHCPHFVVTPACQVCHQVAPDETPGRRLRGPLS
jgi:hypothetical protein